MPIIKDKRNAAVNDDRNAPQILVADDNTNNLKLIHTLLSDNGFRTRLAINGKSALKSAWSTPPDLILLDITMPEMDGFEVCRRLKENDATSGVPVIFLSALRDDPDIVQGFSVGGVDFITKPFRSEVLLARINTHLTIHKLRTQLSQVNKQLEQEVQDRTETLSDVYKISQSLTEETKLHEIFVRLIESVVSNTAAQRLLLVLGVGEARAVAASRSGENNEISLSHQAIEQNLLPVSVVKKIEKTRSTVLFDSSDDATDDGLIDPYFDTKRPNAYMCVPLRYKDSVIGSFYLETYDPSSSFTVHHLQFVEILLSQAAVSIENARLYMSLEQKVEERTAELKAAQGALVKKERLATLGQLTASVAHELRHPIGTIGNSVYILKRQSVFVSSSVTKIIDRIDRNVLRCNSIISEMLEFARDKIMQLETIDMSEWVDKLIDEIPKPEGLSVSKRLQTGAWVDIDIERFRRVLINLVDNACQAMSDNQDYGAERNGSNLTIIVEIYDGQVLLSVCDTGPGIPEDEIASIFEPLFSTKSFGVGLGLPIANQIVESHNGSLEFRSTIGEGTQVVCALPMSSAENVRRLK